MDRGTRNGKVDNKKPLLQLKKLSSTIPSDDATDAEEPSSSQQVIKTDASAADTAKNAPQPTLTERARVVSMEKLLALQKEETSLLSILTVLRNQQSKLALEKMRLLDLSKNMDGMEEFIEDEADEDDEDDDGETSDNEEEEDIYELENWEL